MTQKKREVVLETTLRESCVQLMDRELGGIEFLLTNILH